MNLTTPQTIELTLRAAMCAQAFLELIGTQTEQGAQVQFGAAIQKVRELDAFLDKVSGATPKASK